MKRVVLSLLLLSGMGWMPVCADMPRLGDGFDPALTNASRLVFWVDANVNCITNAEGAVTQWADVREVFADGIPTTNDHTFVYNRGRVHLPAEGSTDIGGTPPTFKTDDRHPGMKFLDFGDYGSGQWMYLANPAGNHFRQNVGTFYCILGFNTENNSGHILSDIAALDAKAAGRAFFHKEWGGQAGGKISPDNDWDNSMSKGATYLDGVRIDPRAKAWNWGRYQMFGQVGPYLVTHKDLTTPTTPYFSTLLNDRNNAFDGSVSGYRQGGAVIGELLVWDAVLSEAERHHVEAYLRAKWFGITTTREATLAAGETVVVDNGAKDAFVEAVTGAGTLVKRGAGTTTWERHAGDDAATVQLEAGTFVVAGGRTDDLPINPVPGKKVAQSEGIATVSAALSDTVAEISGQSATIRPVDLAGKTLAAAANTRIHIASVAGVAEVPLAERYPNLLQNGSFEEGLAHWTATEKGVGAEAGKDSTWYNGDSAIPDGEKFLRIQARPPDSTVNPPDPEPTLGAASQTFTAPVDGLYRLTFYMTRRKSRSEPDGSLVALFSVDGTNFYRNAVYEDYRGSKNEFKLYSAYLPPLKKGEHVLTLTLDGTTTEKDRALVLDDLRLTPIAEGDYVYVPNAGMDSGTEPVTPYGSNGYLKNGVIEGWAVSCGEGGTEGSGGLTQMSSYWNWKNSVETPILADYRKAYLQRDYQMETTITLPRDGRIRLSFTYANRSNSGYPNITGSARGTGHRVEVSLHNDETNVLVATASPVSPFVRTCRGACDLKAGTYTLRIRNNRQGLTTDISAIVDDVRIVYVDSEPPRLIPPVMLVDGEDPAWTSSSEQVLYANDISTARDEVQIPRGTWATWSVDVPSNGLYRLSLVMGGQRTSASSHGGVHLGSTYYPARFAVKVDDVVAGVYVFQDDILRTINLTLPYLTAGEHAIRLETVLTGTAEKAMVRVADLDLRPLGTGSLPAKDVTQETRLCLTSGATLDLLYEGQMFVREFSVDGKKHTGTLSRETAGLADVLTGPGELVVVPRGTILLFR